jgi:hypothetical protein
MPRVRKPRSLRETSKRTSGLAPSSRAGLVVCAQLDDRPPTERDSTTCEADQSHHKANLRGGSFTSSLWWCSSAAAIASCNRNLLALAQGGRGAPGRALAGYRHHPAVSDDLTGLVPRAWWGITEQSPGDPTWAPHRERARTAPLPEVAVRYYTAAGCWVLADELHRLTGLPVGAEVNPWGKAYHVFVVHESDAIDAMGRTPLAELRRIEETGGRVILDVTVSDMLATVEERPWHKEAALVAQEMLLSDEHRACVAEAARRVAAATGLSD